jgi:hypothetical protein
MMMFKTKERKTDKLFRQFIRRRDNYTCQRCGRVYLEDNCRNLCVSHYWGRGRENTRFDPENCIALCHLPCHELKWGHGDGRGEYMSFMLKRLGQKGYDLLELRANTCKKRDDYLDELYLRQLLKELESY